MPVNRGGKKPAPKQQQAPVEIVRPTYVEIGESINVQEFSKLIKREVNEVIKALFMLGVMVTINQDIDFDTAQLIGDNFGVEVGQKAPEEDPTEIPEVDDPPEKRVPRPPVITVMGHVTMVKPPCWTLSAKPTLLPARPAVLPSTSVHIR